MSSTDAPMLVGEQPLIQVISESANEPSATPELFTPPSPSPPLDSENLMDGSTRPPELPDALLRLQKSGHHLQVVSCASWNVRGSAVRIRKELSVCFSVDTIISTQDIIVGLDNAGIDIDDITSIQRRVSNNSWVVTFGSKAVKDTALNEQSITIAGCSVFLGDCENRVSIVKIYELPDEMPDSVVIGLLIHYGKVISFRRDRMADAILNGVRTARMLIERPIPAQTFIAGEFVRFWYPSQPKTCRKCGSEDHLAATCKSTRCFNCERPGHRAEQCHMPGLCHVCLADSHETTNCPFIYYSANITGAKPTDKPAERSYSGAAKTGKFDEAARKAEEDSGRAKREEDERVRREERARKERERKEKEQKERKDQERKERERKEKEREDRDCDDRRERRKQDKYSERRHKDDDGFRRDERSDRERDRDHYRSSRDRSSHRDRETDDSGSESEGRWTTVSYRRDKGKSKSY